MVVPGRQRTKLYDPSRAQSPAASLTLHYWIVHTATQHVRHNLVPPLVPEVARAGHGFIIREEGVHTMCAFSHSCECLAVQGRSKEGARKLLGLP